LDVLEVSFDLLQELLSFGKISVNFSVNDGFRLIEMSLSLADELDGLSDVRGKSSFFLVGQVKIANVFGLDGV